MLRNVHFISDAGSTSLAILKVQKPGGKLENYVRTVAIVCNNPGAEGIRIARENGFSPEDIHLVNSRGEELSRQLLEILKRYDPDYFHQLGWMPLTPKAVIEKYQGLNQHLGPGGGQMRGERRIYVFMRFCELIGQKRPIPIFCQRVAPKLDEGEIIYIRYENIFPGETAKEVNDRLMTVEHEVQIEALYRLARNIQTPMPVPKIARTPMEEEFLRLAKTEAEKKYGKR